MARYHDEEEELISMSLGDHLAELQMRLWRAMAGLVLGLVVSLFFGGQLVKILLIPYEDAMKEAGKQPGLLPGNVLTTFMVYLKICLVAGLILSSFWVFHQLWAFVAAGLYRRERRFVKIIAPVSASLFVVGALFYLFKIAPLALKFFVRFDLGIQFIHTGMYPLHEYVDFMLTLMLVFGLSFQMPLAIIAIERVGLVTLEQFSKARKVVILGLVVFAAVVTPGPDVISQVSLAVPMYLLFEGSLIVCRLLRMRDKKKKEAERAASAPAKTPAPAVSAPAASPPETPVEPKSPDPAATTPATTVEAVTQPEPAAGTDGAAPPPEAAAQVPPTPATPPDPVPPD